MAAVSGDSCNLKSFSPAVHNIVIETFSFNYRPPTLILAVCEISLASLKYTLNGVFFKDHPEVTARVKYS